jgi:hypothetical protein
MAKKKKKNLLGTQIALVLVLLIVAVVMYKQVYLSSQVIKQLPNEAFTQALGQCFQENLTPSMLNKATDNAANNFNLGGLELNNLLDGVWGQVSDSLIETKIDQNYVTEIKVLQIQDLWAENADIRLIGRVTLHSEVPVVGTIESEKHYKTVLFKRAETYYFESLQVKPSDAVNWEVWDCQQRL